MPSEPNSQKFETIQVEIAIQLGCVRPTIKELMRLEPDSILPLDRTIEDPVELYIGERLIALGELVEESEGEATNLSIRILQMVQPVGATQ